MSKILILGIAMFILIFIPGAAKAHVLTTDTTGKVGAVIHINPDDDPIAGEKSDIYFDVKLPDLPSDPHLVNLKVINSSGTATFIPSSVNGTKVAGSYIFPTRGVYIINLILDTGRSGSVEEPRYLAFEYSQRVSRGLSADQFEYTPPLWAEALLIISGGGWFLITALGFSSWRSISGYSREK